MVNTKNNNSGISPSVKLANSTLECVSEFVYPGSLFTMNNECSLDIKHKINLVKVSGNSKSKGKGNVDLYSASSRTHLTRSDVDQTVLPANNTISAFTRQRSQAAPPRIYA